MTTPPPAPVACVDTETYRNYWLYMADTGEVLEMFNGECYSQDVPVTRQQFSQLLAQSLRSHVNVTFNGVHYDMPMIVLAMQGASTEQLKQTSDAIIMQGMKHWDVCQVPDWIDHIDLFDVAPGQGSLKAYAAKMHSRRLQDLPIAPAAIITQEQRMQLRDYCGNSDLPATRDLLNTFPTQLDLRRGMSAEYGIDLRSKSDAQIAEAVMRQVLPFRVNKPPINYGLQFYYRPPAWLEFVNLDVLALLARSPFTISDSGAPNMTKELAETLVRIGDSAYQMGMGGLHSTEAKVMHAADAHTVLSDHDVASYYPSLILVTGIYPMQIGEVFKAIYRQWYDRRLAAKRAGDKKNANSLKTLLNGTFGKLGNQWSIFYAPAELIQVTITGQLALLMLIERLELCGVRVISANTDGIVLKTPTDRLWIRDQVLRWWEAATGLETEANEYRMLASRDVNSYVAIKPDGEVKTKGVFATPEPGPSGWPNPTGQISVDAAVAWLRDGTPLADTVHACTDVRQFVHVRAAKGGGSFCPNGTLPPKTTQKAMREVCGDLPKLKLFAAYAEAVELNKQEREYLGKTVRWYYAKGSRGCIVTASGSLVARAEGCRPVMTLPDALPADLDHQWYIDETASLLRDMGVTGVVD